MTDQTETLAPGMNVRVTQQMRHGAAVNTTSVAGTVVSFTQARTGSWYAHTRDNKLWLDRLTLRTEDGETIVVNLDQYSHIEVID